MSLKSARWLLLGLGVAFLAIQYGIARIPALFEGIPREYSMSISSLAAFRRQGR